MKNIVVTAIALTAIGVAIRASIKTDRLIEKHKSLIAINSGEHTFLRNKINRLAVDMEDILPK